jgi:hypothetical protein
MMMALLMLNRWIATSDFRKSIGLVSIFIGGTVPISGVVVLNTRLSSLAGVYLAVNEFLSRSRGRVIYPLIAARLAVSEKVA